MHACARGNNDSCVIITKHREWSTASLAGQPGSWAGNDCPLPFSYLIFIVHYNLSNQFNNKFNKTSTCYSIKWLSLIKEQLITSIKNQPGRQWLLPSAPRVWRTPERASAEHEFGRVSHFRDFKDTVYPLFASDTLFLECLFVLFLVI